VTGAGTQAPREPGNQRVSVIVATHNDLDNLRACLASLARQTYPATAFEVVLVDDGSTDGTSDAVGREHPDVRLVTKPNEGAEIARNCGVDASTGEVVAFLDSDCVAPPGWLRAVVDRLAPDPGRVVGGRIIHRGGFWRRLTGIADFGEYQGLARREVRTLPSCNMGLHRALFDQVRFDPRLAPNADTLFAEGLHRRGATLLYDPELAIEHRPDVDWAKLLARARRYGRSFVEARRLAPDLRWAGFVRAGVPGVVAATLGRTLLDWSRLIRHRRAAGFRLLEVPPAMVMLLLRRVVSVPEAVRAVIETPKKNHQDTKTPSHRKT
jgi:glycosyltransferase involved in cell wall biosynthesis